MALLNIISNLIGYLVIAGSVLFQLPQIYTILSRKSAAGISLWAYFVETSMFSVSLAWGVAHDLDLANYGESIPVFIQLIAVIILIGYYSNHMGTAITGATLLCLMTYTLASKFLPSRVLDVLYATQVLSVIGAKLPQVYLTFRRKATGTLNLFTVLLMFAGASARVVTTVISVSWEQGKVIMTTGFAVAVILNGLMVMQFCIYPRDLPKNDKEGEEDYPQVSGDAADQRSPVNNTFTDIIGQGQVEESRIVEVSEDLPPGMVASVNHLASHVIHRSGNTSRSKSPVSSAVGSPNTIVASKQSAKIATHHGSIKVD